MAILSKETLVETPGIRLGKTTNCSIDFPLSSTYTTNPSVLSKDYNENDDT